MKIEEVVKRYKDECVLVVVLEEDEIEQPTEVELIVHSKARDEIVNRVSVLGKEMRDEPCIVHDLPETSRVDGLLGLSFLRRFKICLDFRGGVLEIE
jgi:hypothetical protein